MACLRKRSGGNYDSVAFNYFDLNDDESKLLCRYCEQNCAIQSKYKLYVRTSETDTVIVDRL